MKQRFEDAQVGDLVYSRLHGKGIIQSNFKDIQNVEQLQISFFSGGVHRYNLSGYMFEEDMEPMLFYRDETSNYLVERPKRKVPWAKVPVDTKVLVSISIDNPKFKRYFSTYIDNIYEYQKYSCFIEGATSWSNNYPTKVNWKYCELAEEITIEGVTYYPGDN